MMSNYYLHPQFMVSSSVCEHKIAPTTMDAASENLALKLKFINEESDLSFATYCMNKHWTDNLIFTNTQMISWVQVL